MNNKEVELVLECMAVDMTGALCDTKEPMRDVLKQRIEAINIAQKALRQNNAASGEPLTLEQLREMNGKAVRVSPKNEHSELGGVCVVSVGEGDEYSGAYIPGVDHWYWSFDSYNDQWLAYAYKPAHIDREAWKPCKYCGGEKTLYQHTNSTKLFMNTFGKAATLVTECNACPPYADCCMKGISANSAFKINFCPACGRPLTDEAWDAIEKRIRGDE